MLPQGSVQNLHQLSAAEGDGLAGLDVLGLVAGDAVDVGVIGGADLGDLVGLLLGQTLNAEETENLAGCVRLYQKRCWCRI